jgi:hypothetical protein
MNYYVANYKGETLLFSTAGLPANIKPLFSGVALDPREVAVRWIRLKYQAVPKYVTVSQRSFGCWEIESDLL